MTLLVGGTALGATTQHFASADIGSGDRPVFVPITPCRLADTRPAPNTVGPRSAPLAAADTHSIDAQQAGTDCSGEIPVEATALSLNVTALGATAQSFLTIWGDGDRPEAASLNPAPGQPPVPNAVTTELSAEQRFNVYNNAGSVNVVVDVNGYYEHHHHDDRYYSKTDADARFAPLPEAPASIELDVFDMQLMGDWSAAAGIATSGTTTDCAQHALDDDLVDGLYVDSIDVVYRTGAPAEVVVGVVGLINTPGPLAGGVGGTAHLADLDVAFPSTAPETLGAVHVVHDPSHDSPAAPYGPIDAAANETVVQICSEDAVTIVGVTVNFSTTSPETGSGSFDSFSADGGAETLLGLDTTG